MKSILYIAKRLKIFTSGHKYVVVYGAGNVALRCKSLLDNCHINVDYFIITGHSVISENDRIERIEGVSIKEISGFPYTDDMTLENTGVIIAVSDKYIMEVQANLDKMGIRNIFIYPERMKGASIGITTKKGCTVACEYCPQNVFVKNYEKRKNAAVLLTLEQFKKYLHHIPKEVQINFAGFAEPFLNPECSSMIRYAHEQGYMIEIYTTLVGVTKEIIDLIFDSARFVLHLPDEENKTHIEIDDSYIDCLKKLFEKNKINKRISYISAPMGVNSKLIPYIPDDVEVRRELCNRAGNLSGISGWSTSGSVSCERTYNRLDKNVMLPNGEIVLCCNDWGLKNILGNLGEQTWVDILDGDIANSIRSDMLLGKGTLICHSCDATIELTD